MMFANAVQITVRLGRLELWAIFPNRENKGRKLPLVMMELQLKTVREEFADHDSHLIGGRCTFHIGRSADIVPVLLYPIRSADDLLHLHAISEHHQVSQGRVDGDQIPTSKREDLHRRAVRVIRLDGSNLNSRLSVSGHQL